MSNRMSGNGQRNALAALIERRAAKRILVRGDCCCLRLIKLNPHCFADDCEIFSVEKAPSLLCTDYLDGLRVSYDELTGSVNCERLDAFQHYYLLSQIRLAPLHENNIDLLVMDSYSDMNFSLYQNRENAVKFWLDRGWLRAPDEFDRRYEWLGYCSFAEAVERNIRVITHVRQRNPGVPVLFLSQPIDYYPDLQKRREFGFLGAELERALPDVFWGGVLSDHLVPADMDSCGPGETLHFAAESYLRMLEFACRRGTVRQCRLYAPPLEPALAPAKPAPAAGNEGVVGAQRGPDDAIMAAKSAEPSVAGSSETVEAVGRVNDQQPANDAQQSVAQDGEVLPWQIVGDNLVAADGSACPLPEVAEGRVAWFAYGANTIECAAGCVENQRNFEKSLASYVLFEDEPLTKVLGYHAACIDLRGYPNFEEFEAKVRPLSKGNKAREARKASSLGYYCKPFAWRQHIPDVVAINRSKDERSGGPMRADYLKNVEEMGGAPQAPIPLTWPSCSYHWGIVFGVFLRIDGYRQGEVRTDEQLLGYVSLRRYGNVVLYSQILGHGAHLPNNIMALLHFQAVRWLLDTDNTYAKGLRYLMYGGWESGGDDLRLWKKRVGFLPYYAVGSARVSSAATLLDAEGVRVPASLLESGGVTASNPPAVEEKAVLTASEAVQAGKALEEAALDLPAEEVSEQERGKRLTEIRQQANRSTFPVDILANDDRVLSLFSGGFSGRNDVIHLVDAEVSSIVCNDRKPENLADLQYRYGDLVAEYYSGDAFALVESFRGAGRTFTTVVADPFTGLMPSVWNALSRFLAVAERFAVIGVSGDCLGEIGTSAEGLQDWVTGRGIGAWRVLRLLLRNQGMAGGVYWAVLQNG